MKTLALATVLIALTTSAYSEEAATPPAPTCKMQAGVTATRDKPLSGAALTSFMKKCEADAKADCDKKAADKKLNGAAKTSFTNKCVKDEVGA